MTALAPSLRLDVIDWLLLTRGAVRRGDIVEATGLSQSWASKDIAEFLDAHPGAMIYNLRAKCYVPAESPYRSRRGMDAPEADAAMRWIVGRLAAA